MYKADGTYEYVLGQNVGIIDNVDFDDPYVKWYKLVYMETDNDLPIGWLYLADENPNKNPHVHPNGFVYAEIIDSINSKLVVED